MPEILNIVQGSAELWVDGVNMGFTYESVKQTLEREYTDIIVEQVKGPISSVLVMENSNITTVLSEITLNNVRMAWDQAGSSLIGGTFLSIGTEGGANFHTLTIVAPANPKSGYLYKNYHIFKALSYANVESDHARGAQSKIPVTFKCFKDVLNGNLFGYVNHSNVKGA